MQYLWSILAAVAVAALGCWLSAHFIPAGTPRLFAQIGSVVAGFGAFFGWRRLAP